jgi:hypothetical protein
MPRSCLLLHHSAYHFGPTCLIQSSRSPEPGLRDTPDSISLVACVCLQIVKESLKEATDLAREKVLASTRRLVELEKQLADAKDRLRKDKAELKGLLAATVGRA